MKINYRKDIKNIEESSQIDINVTVSPEEYTKIWNEQAEEYAKNITIKGFRKGFAPIATVKTAYANEISEQAFNKMVNTVAQEIVSEVEIKPISTIRINIPQKEADNKEIEFLLSYAYRINPVLPNLANIKVEDPKIEVSDDEIQQSLDMLLQSLNSKKEEGRPEFNEWNEEAIKALNIQGVSNLDELKTLIKSEIDKQKAYEAEMKHRTEILDKIVAESKVIVPQIIVEDMLQRQEDDYVQRIEKLGFKFEDYIKEKNINMDDLRQEWEQLIKADLARELILSQYVMDNEIKPQESDIDQLIQSADTELKERYTPEGLRQYMSYVYSNNLAFNKIIAEVTGKEA